MSTQREFDIIVFGSTGYTGRLVAEHIHQQHGKSKLRWAVAGRDLDKLESVCSEISIPSTTPKLVADINDPVSMKALTQATKVMVTTAGPYSLYGEPQIAACVETGTDYVDLCGEPLFMHRMIEKYDTAAKASGARIVFSGGFESVSMELGVWFIQQAVIARTGKPSKMIKSRVVAMQGGGSGGSAASFRETDAEIAANPSLASILSNPFALCEGFVGPEQPNSSQPVEEPDLDTWSTPFFLSPLNIKNLHRANTLRGHPYGKDFRYSEMLCTAPGEAGKKAAFAMFEMKESPYASLEPGEGPSAEQRLTGYVKVLFVAETDQGPIKAVMSGDRDPGYGLTSRILAETGLCLASGDAAERSGVMTPSTVMDKALIARLRDYANVTYDIAE